MRRKFSATHVLQSLFIGVAVDEDLPRHRRFPRGEQDFHHVIRVGVDVFMIPPAQQFPLASRRVEPYTSIDVISFDEDIGNRSGDELLPAAHGIHVSVG